MKYNYQHYYKLIDYDGIMLRDLSYVGMQFSEDMKLTLNNYLFLGFKPGGHISALLANDFERAFHNADIHSRRVIWATVKFISDHVPDLAKGSYDAIEFWCDHKTLREEFAEECEKKKMWDILTEKSE
mgnify:CR=1 FL=1